MPASLVSTELPAGAGLLLYLRQLLGDSIVLVLVLVLALVITVVRLRFRHVIIVVISMNPDCSDSRPLPIAVFSYSCKHYIAAKTVENRAHSEERVPAARFCATLVGAALPQIAVSVSGCAAGLDSAKSVLVSARGPAMAPEKRRVANTRPRRSLHTNPTGSRVLTTLVALATVTT